MAEDQVTDPESTDNPTTDPSATTDNPEPQTPELPRWHHSLPDPLKGHESLKGFATIGDAAKAYVELSGRSERMVEVPGADATEAQKEEFYKALGRPETPDQYELKKPSDWPGNTPWSSQDSKRFAEKAYMVGLSKAQAERLHRLIVDDAKNMILDHGLEEKKRGEAREQALRELFGSKVDENVTLAQRSMEMVGGPACREELERSGLLRSPVQVRAWKRIWEAIGEDRIFAGAADPDGSTQEARLKALYPNTDW